MKLILLTELFLTVQGLASIRLTESLPSYNDIYSDIGKIQNLSEITQLLDDFEKRSVLKNKTRLYRLMKSGYKIPVYRFWG